MISRPPSLVIQRNMARNLSLYHAPDSTRWANHGDFFNTYRRFHSLTPLLVNWRCQPPAHHAPSRALIRGSSPEVLENSPATAYRGRRTPEFSTGFFEEMSISARPPSSIHRGSSR